MFMITTTNAMIMKTLYFLSTNIYFTYFFMFSSLAYINILPKIPMINTNET